MENSKDQSMNIQEPAELGQTQRQISNKRISLALPRQVDEDSADRSSLNWYNSKAEPAIGDYNSGPQFVQQIFTSLPQSRYQP